MEVGRDVVGGLLKKTRSGKRLDQTIEEKHLSRLRLNVFASFPNFPSCGICFSFLQLVLAHQNFECVRNPHCGRHCITAAARLYLCQRCTQGRRRLYTFSLSLLQQRQRLQETTTSPFSQPLPHDSHLQNTLSHTTPVSSSSSSATPSTSVPTSPTGKPAGPTIVMLVITRKKQTAASHTPCTCTPGHDPQHPWYNSA